MSHRRCEITNLLSTCHTFIIFHCHLCDTYCTMKERCDCDVTLIVAVTSSFIFLVPTHRKRPSL